MVEIEDRWLKFKSWKSYARFLKTELSKLQQLSSNEHVELAYNGAVKKYF